MIRNISVKNYKSIEDLNISLGRINVFIGENGAGKSNVLEAIALAGAAAADKVDSEFLASRGIRATDSHLMRCAFDEHEVKRKITIEISTEQSWSIQYSLDNDGTPYSQWTSVYDYLHKSGDSDFHKNHEEIKSMKKLFFNILSKSYEKQEKTSINYINKQVEFFLTDFLVENTGEPQKSKNKKINENLRNLRSAYLEEKERCSSINENLSKFLIFSPENSALRDFTKEGQVQPLGISGEGLFKLLKVEQKENTFKHDLENFLNFFGWFESLDIPDSASHISHIKAKDKYIKNNNHTIDLRSANEGFLFLAFYFALFRSNLTPSFFAIDNIDASLNPKLCKHIIQKINELSKNTNKQSILTTHNPAILDGLDLNDDEQRLFVIERNSNGRTVCRRINKPESPIPGRSVRLSTMFMDGTLGGIPKSF